MALTVREKEHWKERISRRIDHAVETVQAEHDPTLMQRIREEAEQKALDSLGIADLKRQCEQIGDEIARLEEQRHDAWTEMLATVRGMPLGEVHPQRCEPYEVRLAVERRKAVHERELLNEHPLGRRIAQLLEEKDELLDTVWLATSPVQIKQLWSKFAEVLQWEPPEMQKEALAIPAVPDEPTQE
jgi:hypothetical protein